LSQLKNGALATLRIAKQALDFGMCLKDSSAYNIQFRKGKPVLIDTLSFERYVEGEPSKVFTIAASIPIRDSDGTVYWMTKRTDGLR